VRDAAQSSRYDTKSADSSDTRGMSRPATAYIHLASLRHNYRLLNQKAGNARTMAVVKANAYGHGLDLVAPALMDEGCRLFAVTDAEEGARLRDMIGKEADITLLSGIFDRPDARLCSRHGLTPVVTEVWHLKMLQTGGFTGNVWIKVDTGMHRLGCEDVSALSRACGEYGIGIAGIMSHLACADTPDHPLNRRQAEAFRQCLTLLPAPVPASLLNSAGLISMPEFSMDVVRPGITLYGVEPVINRPIGLQPVMKLTSRIMQLRAIRKGDSVSYGASFIAPKGMRIAVAALGYADGLPRSLSNRGFARCKGAILPVVGRVCMDYCLLDAGQASLSTGDEVEFWSESMPVSGVARLADTIAYELFTGVSPRVRRKAVE